MDRMELIEKLQGMLSEALVEWEAWARESGCKLEADPGPDGQKYRKIKKFMVEIREG